MDRFSRLLLQLGLLLPLTSLAGPTLIAQEAEPPAGDGSGATQGSGPDGPPAPEADADSPDQEDQEQAPPTNEQQDPAGPGGEDATPPVASAQDVQLENSVVTATRGQRRSVEVPQAVNSIDSAEFRRRLAPTTPDTLEEEVGVVVQKTNLGGGSPILRGRSGKSVLLLVDGRRFNTSTYRSNNQYLNTLGLSAVDRLEVVRGPSSVLYGSDAMGGAVNVLTRRREPTGENSWAGRAYAQYETATAGSILHLGLDGEVAKTGFTLGVTRKSFDDLRAGYRGNPAGTIPEDERQKNTGYDELGMDLSLSRRIADNSTLDFLYLHTRQSSVPRTDRLTANEKQPVAPDLRREVDPQVLRMFELRYRYEEPGEVLESFSLTATFLNPEETRRRVRTSDPNTQINEYDSTTVPGFSAQFNFRANEQHLITTGFDADYESLNSRRETVDLSTGMVTPSANGRYPDDAVYQSYGVYAQDEWSLNERTRWTNGLRYSYFKTRYDLGGLTVGPEGPYGKQSETYDDFTMATSLIHQWTDTTWVYGSISRGFRAPNLDDQAVLGDFSSGERIPNPDLDPESVWNFEAGMKHENDRWRGGTTAAYARYTDLFDTRFLFSQGGEDFFQVDNDSRAHIVTLEGWFECVALESEQVEHSFFAQGFATWGRDTSNDEPLQRIPPPQGELGWRTESLDGDWSIEYFARGAMKQDRLSAADKADPRIPIGGTPAWATLNVRGQVRVSQSVTLTAALENLLDRRYRVHGSGIDAPGLNAVVAVDWRF